MNVVAAAQPAVEPSPHRLIAPLWHTALFLIVLGGLAGWGTYRHGVPAFGNTRTISYLITIAEEWILLLLAAWGLRMGGVSVRSVIGGRWSSGRDVLRDVGIGFAFLIGSNILLAALSAVLHPSPNPNIARMLPHSPLEMALWICISLTAGICEEFTFRGYLQKQLSGLFKNGTAGILAQGFIFGAAHAYQGLKLMFSILLLGCMLGWLARWRNSLRPGMISHFLQDAAGGIILGGH